MIRLAIVPVVLGILFIPLEKLRPVRRGQLVLRTGVRTDVLHFVFTGTLGAIALIVLAIVVVLPLQALAPDALAETVQSQPWLLQLVAALLIVEVGGYWAHRAHDEIPALWKLHRVHHSSEQMDWLASAHLHPLDSATSRIVAVVPLALLGFSRETFGATLVILQLHAIFQHANMRVRFGGFGQVVSSPHFHHWHHAGDMDARDRNYSGMFPWLDRIFGTYHAPVDRWPTRYGIDDPMPAGYLGQLRSTVREGAGADVMDTDDVAMGVPDLPTIDLAEAASGPSAGVPLDRRTYEDRFAELGFGLGVVPRKLRRDDAWWETPAGMLAIIGFVLLVLWTLASVG